MYRFQDCEFEIGKPVCVLCVGYKTRGWNKEPDRWFPLLLKKEYHVKELDTVTKVKKSYVSKITFSPIDHKSAVSLELENGVNYPA